MEGGGRGRKVQVVRQQRESAMAQKLQQLWTAMGMGCNLLSFLLGTSAFVAEHLQEVNVLYLYFVTLRLLYLISATT